MLPNEKIIHLAFHADNEGRQTGYFLSSDRDKLDRAYIVDSLKSFSWGENRTVEKMDRAIEGSICIGVYLNDPETGSTQQVGFCRIVTDGAVLCYLMDVFIDPEHRRKGLGAWMEKTTREHPELRDIAVWRMSTTEEAQSMYRKNGWTAPAKPGAMMEIVTGR